jgi:hypothetical protein
MLKVCPVGGLKNSEVISGQTLRMNPDGDSACPAAGQAICGGIEHYQITFFQIAGYDFTV